MHTDTYRVVSNSRHILSGSSSLHHSPSTDENKPMYPTLDPDYDEKEEQLTVRQLQNRILRDQIVLKILQERQKQQKDTANVKIPPDTSIDVQNHRKKFARSQEIILKHMLKITKECGVKAFVYGIVPDSGKPISAVSDNLRNWWQERVKFDHSAPAAIVKYEHDIGVIGADNPYAPPTVGPSSLMELQDQTLGSILSALLQHCSPPQRKFPLDNGIAPPWWPKGNEEWWPALGFPDGIQDTPYKKPHDLKKVIKCGVIMAVLRHMLPKVEEILMLVGRSRGLQDKMSMREIHVWFSIVKHEEELFWERNKGFPWLHRSKKLELTDLIEISGGCDEAESDVDNGGVSSDERQAIYDLMSLYEEGNCDNASQTLHERERKEFDANVESLSQDLLKLVNSDAMVPMELSYATKPIRFTQRESNKSCIDDEMKQMEMRHCLQLQQVEMEKMMKAPKRMSQNLHIEMSQSLKQQQMDMNQNMQQNLQMQQLLNMNQTPQYHQSYQNKAYNQLAYNQIEMSQNNLERYVNPTGNIEFLQLQNQNNNIKIQNQHLEDSNFAFGQQQNLQQDQLAETSSGNHNLSQMQQHYQPVNNFSSNYDNSMQERNAGSMENLNSSTEMDYEFDEFELDYLIASADAFMHDI